MEKRAPGGTVCNVKHDFQRRLRAHTVRDAGEQEDVGEMKNKKSIRTTAEMIVTQMEPEKPDFTL